MSEKPRASAAMPDDPPKRPRGRPRKDTSPRPARAASPAGAKRSLTEPLTKLGVTLIAATLYPFDKVCGEAWLRAMPAIATELNAIAQSDARIYNALKGIGQAGKYAGLVGALGAPIILTAAHHNLMPDWIPDVMKAHIPAPPGPGAHPDAEADVEPNPGGAGPVHSVG